MKAIVMRKENADILVVDEMDGSVYKLYRTIDEYRRSHGDHNCYSLVLSEPDEIYCKVREDEERIFGDQSKNQSASDTQK